MLMVGLDTRRVLSGRATIGTRADQVFSCDKRVVGGFDKIELLSSALYIRSPSMNTIIRSKSRLVSRGNTTCHII